MAEKKYYWLKLKRDFFKRHDIKIIEAMPNGKDYILFYLKLLVESVDHNGELRFSETIPYDDNMLSIITNTNVDVVKNAMKVFTDLKMIDILNDATIYMNEVDKLLGTETYWAEQKRLKREKEKAPDFKFIQAISYERLKLPNGKIQYVDNKRYGGNAFLAYEYAEGKCEICGSSDNLCIHHDNDYSNELSDLKVLCRKCHSIYGKRLSAPTEIGICPQIVQDVQVLSKQELETDIDIEKDTDKKKKKVKKFKEEIADRLWESYPLKKGKSDAYKHIEKLIEKGITEEQLLTCIENYKLQIKDPQFTYHGSTFFCSKWEDYLKTEYVSQAPKAVW